MSNRKTVQRCCLAITVALWCQLAPAFAADDPPQPETALFDDEVVSAAAKHLQPISEAPTSVTIIGSEELRRFGYRTLAEALRSVPGLYVSSDRNYSYLGVRGFQRPGDFSDRVLLLVNGHTLNDDIYQRAPIGEDFGVDIEAVERIEVVRGPGAALYGGNAFFAVINVVTITAGDAIGGQARADFGSYARKRGQASYGYSNAAGLELFASGSVLDVDGPAELYYREYDSPAFNDGRANDANAERALKLFVSGRYRGFSLQASAVGREQHIPTGAFGTAFNDSDSKTLDQRGFVELRHGAELLPNLRIELRVYYDYLRTHTTLIYGSGEDRIKNETRASSDWLGSELRLRYPIFWRQTLTAGIEHSYHPDANQKNYDLPSDVEYLDHSRTFHDVGVFAQDEIALLPRLTVIAGVRYDNVYDHIEEWSPRVAAVWRPFDSTVLKFLYGTAFRAPNLFESYATVVQDSYRRLANSNLDAEHITTYEAALEHEQWGAHFTFTGFHDDIKDLISQVELTGQPVPTTQFQNRDSVDANGFETSMRVPLPQRFALRSAYSLQVSRLPDDRRLSNSPQHTGDVAILFPLAFGAEGAAELLVIGPRDTREGRDIDAVTLLNLNLIYPLPRYHLDLTAGFYNLLDQESYDPGGPEHLQDRIRQDGFTFRVQVGYAF